MIALHNRTNFMSVMPFDFRSPLQESLIPNGKGSGKFTLSKELPLMRLAMVSESELFMRID